MGQKVKKLTQKFLYQKKYKILTRPFPLRTSIYYSFSIKKFFTTQKVFADGFCALAEDETVNEGR